MADESSKRTSFSRTGISIGVLVQSACVLFLAAAVNYIGFNYYKRWDFSRSQKFTLADQTEQVLRQLQSPLKATVYFSSSSISPDAALYGDVQGLLAQLSFSARRKFDIRQVDPSMDVSAARELQEKYKFDGNQNVLILDYNGRTKLIPIIDLGEFDMSGLETGEPAKLTEFTGESVLTAAIIALLNPEKSKIYFVQGHGETLPEKLSVLGDYLGRQNAELVGLNLGATDRVPENADAICIAGPRYDFTDAEINMLQRYWAARGRIVVLIDPDPMIDMPKLRGFLNQTGIHPRNDRVQRLARSDSRPDLVTLFPFVAGVFLPDSPITKRLVGANARLPGATLSLALDNEGAAKSDIQLRGLIQAIEGYWGERNYLDRTKIGLEYNDGEDTGEPVIVAASAEKGAAKDDRTDVAMSRLVVVGNSAFIEDDSLHQAPSDLDFIISVFNRMIEGALKTHGHPSQVGAELCAESYGSANPQHRALHARHYSRSGGFVRHHRGHQAARMNRVLTIFLVLLAAAAGGVPVRRRAAIHDHPAGRGHPEFRPKLRSKCDPRHSDRVRR